MKKTEDFYPNCLRNSLRQKIKVFSFSVSGSLLSDFQNLSPSQLPFDFHQAQSGFFEGIYLLYYGNVFKVVSPLPAVGPHGFQNAFKLLFPKAQCV